MGTDIWVQEKGSANDSWGLAGEAGGSPPCKKDNFETHPPADKGTARKCAKEPPVQLLFYGPREKRPPRGKRKVAVPNVGQTNRDKSWPTKHDLKGQTFAKPKTKGRRS